MTTQRTVAHRRPVTGVLTAAALVALPAGLALAGSSAPTEVERDEQKDAMDDGRITDAVEDEMLFDAVVPSHEIDVSTVDGIVTLEGTVGNLLAKERAVRTAETVKGVRAVVDQLEVDLDEERSAAALLTDVEAALAADPATDSYEVTVAATSDGTVTLGGDVESWAESRLSETVAKGVRGVTDVVNQITVTYPEERPDGEIAAEVRQSLRWSKLIDDGLMNVTVEDGAVSLSGIAGSAAEKRLAIEEAWTAGVSSVDVSDLQVERWARDDELRKEKYVDRSDDEVRQAVLDAMLYDPRVASFRVDPEVDTGIVTLRGTVDNLKAKRAAEKDARHTVGVSAVVNRLKVRPVDTTRTDEDVEASIRDALLRDPYVERFELTIDVVDGVAHLYGDVDSYFERAHADDVVSRVDGVQEVDNHVTVGNTELATVDPYVDDWYLTEFTWYRPEPLYTLESDAEIREDIVDELWWSPFVDAEDVEVSVDDGYVVLTGTVDSWSERRAATENAIEGGAIWVENELDVQP